MVNDGFQVHPSCAYGWGRATSELENSAWVGVCQESGFQSLVSDPGAFIINAIIEQQEQQSDHEET